MSEYRLINCGGKLVFTDKWTMQWEDRGLNIVDVCDEDVELLDKSYDNMPFEFETINGKAKLYFS